VLSLLVASIEIQITLNEDELAAYNSILKLETKSHEDNLHTGVKYLIFKKLSKENLRNPNKQFVVHVLNFIKYKIKFRSNLKYSTKSRTVIEQYLDKFKKDESIYKEGMKFALFKKICFITNKLIDKLDPIMDNSDKTILMAREMKNVAYASNNLSRALIRFNTVGKIKCKD
jgi:hypothetical protein